MGWTPPTSATTFPIRPLQLGMVTDLHPSHLGDGADVVLKNMVQKARGPVRMPGFNIFANGASVPYIPQDYVTLWKSNGAQKNVLITDSCLYAVDPFSGYTEVQWRYSEGTVAVSGSTVTGTGLSFVTNEVKKGDRITIDGLSAIVNSVLTETSLTVESNPWGTVAAGASYYIQRMFSGGNNLYVSWTICDGYLLLADGKHQLMAFDPDSDTISYWMDTTGKMPMGIPCYPSVVAFHDDRIFIANTYDATDGYQKQRLRWSTLSDRRDFSLTTSYLDIPYTSTPIITLMPLGQNLIAYFNDAIYSGRPTSYPLSPYAFTRLESAEVGPAGPKAIAQFIGSHVYAAIDGFHMLTENGVQTLKCGIMSESIKKCSSLGNIYTIVDLDSEAILFGIPGSNRIMEKIWCYEYTTEGWSYFDVSTNMLVRPSISALLTIEGLSGTIDGLDATYPTIDGMSISQGDRSVFVETNGILYKLDTSSNTLIGTTGIPVEIQTKDFDFDGPDSLKTFYRMGIKIDWDTALQGDLIFAVEASTTRGRTWKRLGNVLIPQGMDEGYVNFRVMGEQVRFRITTSSTVGRYYITELDFKVRGTGSGDSRNSQEH